MKTLVMALALGTRNCTILPKPSSCNDSVARSYSASAIDLEDLFLCLKALYLTAGPGDKKMLSLTACSMVLSQIELVISLRNYRRKNLNYTGKRVYKKIGVIGKSRFIDSLTIS